MQQSLDALQIALRVLTALTEKRVPDASDVQALRAYADVEHSRDLDVLACEVILKALRQRAQAREAAR